MNGILVINHFLKSEKFNILHNHLTQTAKNMGITLNVRTNQEMIFCNDGADFVLFWDKDTNLAQALEARGYKVFNSAKSIALCDNKAKTYLALDGIVKQPDTIIAPLAYHDCDYTDFVTKAVGKLGLPVVFKDIRIEVVGGVCVSAMKRSNDADFRSNITNGGKAEPYSPTPQEADTAIKACNALGLTFGGVDILDGGYVCEVNSNAHIINIMNCNGIDVAPLIFDAIKDKI